MKSITLFPSLLFLKFNEMHNSGCDASSLVSVWGALSQRCKGVSDSGSNVEVARGSTPYEISVGRHLLPASDATFPFHTFSKFVDPSPEAEAMAGEAVGFVFAHNRDRTVQRVAYSRGDGNTQAVPCILAPSLKDNPKKANKAKKKAAFDAISTAAPAPTAAAIPPPIPEGRVPCSFWVDLNSLLPSRHLIRSETKNRADYDRVRDDVRDVVYRLLWRLCMVEVNGVFLFTEPRVEPRFDTVDEFKNRKPDGYIRRVLLFCSVADGESDTTNESFITQGDVAEEGVSSRLMLGLLEREDAVRVGVAQGICDAQEAMTTAMAALIELCSGWWNVPSATVTSLEPLSKEGRNEALKHAIRSTVEAVGNSICLTIVGEGASCLPSLTEGLAHAIVGRSRRGLGIDEYVSGYVLYPRETAYILSGVCCGPAVGVEAVRWIGGLMKAMSGAPMVDSSAVSETDEEGSERSDSGLNDVPAFQVLLGAGEWLRRQPLTIDELLRHNAGVPSGPPSVVVPSALSSWWGLDPLRVALVGWSRQLQLHMLETTEIAHMGRVIDSVTYEGYSRAFIFPEDMRDVTAALGSFVSLTSFCPEWLTACHGTLAQVEYNAVEGKAVLFVQCLSWAFIRAKRTPPCIGDVLNAAKGLVQPVAGWLNGGISSTSTAAIPLALTLLRITCKRLDVISEGANAKYYQDTSAVLSKKFKARKRLLVSEEETAAAKAEYKRQRELTKKRAAKHELKEAAASQELTNLVITLLPMLVPEVDDDVRSTTATAVEGGGASINHRVGGDCQSNGLPSNNATLDVLIASACARSGYRWGPTSTTPVAILGLEQLINALCDPRLPALPSDIEGALCFVLERCMGLLWEGHAQPQLNPLRQQRTANRKILPGAHKLRSIVLSHRRMVEGHPCYAACALLSTMEKADMGAVFAGEDLDSGVLLAVVENPKLAREGNMLIGGALHMMLHVRLREFVACSKMVVSGKPSSTTNNNNAIGILIEASYEAAVQQSASSISAPTPRAAWVYRLQHAAKTSRELRDVLVAVSGVSLPEAHEDATHTNVEAGASDDENGEAEEGGDVVTAPTDMTDFMRLLCAEGEAPLPAIRAFLGLWHRARPLFNPEKITRNRMSSLFDLCSGVSRLPQPSKGDHFASYFSSCIRCRVPLFAVFLLRKLDALHEWEVVFAVTIVAECLWGTPAQQQPFTNRSKVGALVASINTFPHSGSEDDRRSATPTFLDLVARIFQEIHEIVGCLLTLDTVSNGGLFQMPHLPLAAGGMQPSVLALTHTFGSCARQLALTFVQGDTTSEENGASSRTVALRRKNLARCRAHVQSEYARRIAITVQRTNPFNTAVHPMTPWFQAAAAWTDPR